MILGFSANTVTVLMTGFNMKGQIKLKVYPCKVFYSYKILFCCLAGARSIIFFP